MTFTLLFQNIFNFHDFYFFGPFSMTWPWQDLFPCFPMTVGTLQWTIDFSPVLVYTPWRDGSRDNMDDRFSSWIFSGTLKARHMMVVPSNRASKFRRHTPMIAHTISWFTNSASGQKTGTRKIFNSNTTLYFRMYVTSARHWCQHMHVSISQ